jgi:hypothetical protein
MGGISGNGVFSWTLFRRSMSFEFCKPPKGTGADGSFSPRGFEATTSVSARFGDASKESLLRGLEGTVASWTSAGASAGTDGSLAFVSAWRGASSPPGLSEKRNAPNSDGVLGVCETGVVPDEIAVLGVLGIRSKTQ